MKDSVNQLIKAERRRYDYAFITKTVQGGRMKPKKYTHQVTMPIFLYEEMRQRGVINTEDYIIDGSAFFEFTMDEATISFYNLYMCEDLHRRIDRYLVTKFAGSYPIKRTGVSKMNFDSV